MNKNKNVLITGTSRGIGNKLAKIYLKNSFNVYGCSRSLKNIQNKNYHHKTVDIGNTVKLQNWLNTFKKKKIKIDILILNAATISRNFFLKEADKSIKRFIDINYTSNFLIIKNLLNNMIINKSGKIVYFSSISTTLKSPGTSLYSSCKTGMENFLEILAKEIKLFNIKIFIFRISFIISSMSNTLNRLEYLKIKKKVKNKIITNEKKIFNLIKVKNSNKNFYLIKDK